MHKTSTMDLVPYVVLHKSALPLINKGVCMNPLAVGAFELGIFELIWGLPSSDFGTPFYGESVDLELVVDTGSLLHFNVTFSDNAELEKSGSDFFKISGVCEKGEYFLALARNASSATEYVSTVLAEDDGGYFRDAVG